MAGLGRKVFNSGDILLASEVQGFLQDQSVMVFDDDAARGSAIATPTEGMVTFRKDDNALEVFDGSVFAPVGSSPGLVHIETRTFSATTAQIFNNVFSSTFDNYKILLFSKGSANQFMFARMRASGTDESGAVYDNAFMHNIGATPTATDGQNDTSFPIGTTSLVANKYATLEIYNPFVAIETGVSQMSSNFGASLQRTHNQSNTVQTSTQYDGISFITTVAGTSTGTIHIYGYAKV